MSEHKSVAEMVGEYLREAAVLSGVFIPLDRILGQKANLTWNYIWVTLGLSAGLLTAGIIMERRRPQKGNS